MTARLLASLGSSRRAHYVGHASHGETTSNIPIPTGARAGDLAVICYLSSRGVIGGGWTASIRGQLAVAYRVLTAGDIVSPPSFTDVTNVITQVVRGPRSLSAERNGVSFTGSSVTMPGFSKSAGCMGLYGATSGEFDDVNIQPFSIFPDGSTDVGPVAFELACRVGLQPSLYLDNADFGVDASIHGGDKNAAVFEFIF